MNPSLGYAKLSDTLARLGLHGRAAEYHGALCGALCVRAVQDIDPLQVLDGADSAAPDDAAETLRRFKADSQDAFDSDEMLFNPLLPDDAEGLGRRVEALSAWCEGFLYGIATGRVINIKQCSPELKEILKDFTDFTRAGMDDDSDAELEEGAYAELVEYIRVGAQLIYMELRREASTVPAHQLH